MRKVLDSSSFGNDDQPRIYFGEHTPVIGEDSEEDRHLKAPSLGKLLFISPPPSPPLGWEIREEEPPNKDVHAEDLQRALAGLHGFKRSSDSENDSDGSGMSDSEKATLEQFKQGGFGKGRKRAGTAGSVVVYHPSTHGDSKDLPAVMVEDMTGEGVVEEGEGGKMLTHTARPPVELMGDA